MRLVRFKSRQAAAVASGGAARATTGVRGEKLAEKYLRKRGMKMLLRRFNCQAGEIDLVMRDGETIVFVEVKTQSDDRLIDPRERVTAVKRARLIRAARWLVGRRRWQDRPLRFDMVAIVERQSAEPRIEHVADAFVPKKW